MNDSIQRLFDECESLLAAGLASGDGLRAQEVAYIGNVLARAIKLMRVSSDQKCQWTRRFIAGELWYHRACVGADRLERPEQCCPNCGREIDQVFGGGSE